MKTKNFILPAIALAALISTSAFAQEKLDFHDQEYIQINDTIKSSLAKANQKEYLSLSLVRAQIIEGLPLNLKHLKKVTKNSLSDKKISVLEQYSLMQLCIDTNSNDILRTLIEAGFNTNADLDLGFVSLSTRAIYGNNLDAFCYTFTFYDEERMTKVLEELKEFDPSLINRFFNFISKCEPKKTSEIHSVNQEKDESTGITVKFPKHLSTYNKSALTDIIPAAPKTIKVVSDTVPNK